MTVSRLAVAAGIIASMVVGGAGPRVRLSTSPAVCSSAVANAPGGSDGRGGCFPGPGNTGVPDETVLTPYTGTCTITVANTVIDSKIVNCDLDIAASGVVIRRSLVNGHIQSPEHSGNSFRVEDSFVDGSPNGPRADRAIMSDNFVVLRSEIVGGQGGILCELDCTVQDSWIHGTDLDPNSEWHASAVRVEQGSTLIHNTLSCDWTLITNDEIGCSADMTGYPDFAPINHNTITGNLFMANPTGLGYCAYGGGSLGKPFSNDPSNATYIAFTDNVFQRGENGKCGTWGAITDFLPDRPGNVWSGNRWSDGTPLPPA
jgi:hypothetical protein